MGLSSRLFGLAGDLGRSRASFGRQQRFTATRTATPARVFSLELGGVRLVNDQAVVVVELFAGVDVAQCLDEDSVIVFIGFTVRLAAVVDPARGIAAVLGIDHMLFIDMKVKGVVRVCRVVGMAPQRFFPADDLADVLNQRLAFSQVLHGKHALAMHAGEPRLDALARGQQRRVGGTLGSGPGADFGADFGHVENFWYG